MSLNGEIVIDLDSHIVERVDRFYQDYIDPGYRDACAQLCDAVAQQAKAGHCYSLFGSRTSVVEPVETGRPLGVRTFGRTASVHQRPPRIARAAVWCNAC